MFKLTVTFITVAFLAQSAFAQDISTCLSDCSSQALTQAGCSGATDSACICSGTYIGSALTCVENSCGSLAIGGMPLSDLIKNTRDSIELICGGQLVTDVASPPGPTGEQPTAPDTGAATLETGATEPDSGSATGTATRSATTLATTNRAGSSSSASRSGFGNSTSTGAGFHTVNVAPGLAIALFGAALTLF